jgi:hypothetical protein
VLGPLERGDHPQQVGALALARRAAEDVEPCRNQTPLDLHDALVEIEDAAIHLFARHWLGRFWRWLAHHRKAVTGDRKGLVFPVTRHFFFLSIPV